MTVYENLMKIFVTQFQVTQPGDYAEVRDEVGAGVRDYGSG